MRRQNLCLGVRRSNYRIYNIFYIKIRETNMIKSQQADGILGLGIESNSKFQCL